MSLDELQVTCLFPVTRRADSENGNRGCRESRTRSQGSSLGFRKRKSARVCGNIRAAVHLKQVFYCTAESAFAPLADCNPTIPRRPSQTACTAESAFFASIAGCPADPTSVSLAGSNPPIPRRVSQAAWFSAGSDPRSSRIIFQAATLRAPSGGSPVARETEHAGQKQIRRAAGSCRGFIPTFET